MLRRPSVGHEGCNAGSLALPDQPASCAHHAPSGDHDQPRYDQPEGGHQPEDHRVSGGKGGLCVVGAHSPSRSDKHDSHRGRRSNPRCQPAARDDYSCYCAAQLRSRHVSGLHLHSPPSVAPSGTIPCPPVNSPITQTLSSALLAPHRLPADSFPCILRQSDGIILPDGREVFLRLRGAGV